jgi:hypothetical protein
LARESGRDAFGAAEATVPAFQAPALVVRILIQSELLFMLLGVFPLLANASRG